MMQTPNPATFDDDDIPAPISKLEVNGRTIHISAFRSLELAFQSAERHPGYANHVIMGDCPWYWVVSPADGQRLDGHPVALHPRASSTPPPQWAGPTTGRSLLLYADVSDVLAPQNGRPPNRRAS